MTLIPLNMTRSLPATIDAYRAPRPSSSRTFRSIDEIAHHLQVFVRLFKDGQMELFSKITTCAYSLARENETSRSVASAGRIEYNTRPMATANIPSIPAAPIRAMTTSEAGHTLFASFLGWTLDAFDFFVLVFVLPKIGAEFHRSVADIAFAITMTLAMRPVGAALFGWLADRYGRRTPLMIDVLLYSVVEVLSGLAPTYGSFLVLRALYGIGMGGEWGVGASLAMEAVAPKWRGFFSGLLQEGYAVGYLLAAGAYFFVYPHFGWRAMFFIGGAPALLTLYIRAKVPESEAWQRTRPDRAAIVRALKKNWPMFLYLSLFLTAMSFVSHGTQDMYPTFLEKQRGLGPEHVAEIAIIYNIRSEEH